MASPTTTSTEDGSGKPSADEATKTGEETMAASASSPSGGDRPNSITTNAADTPSTEAAASRRSPQMSSPDGSSPAPPMTATSTATATHTNRPASVNSTHSGGSSGTNPPPPVRTTTTSRRGGRIRSRSPPTMTNRAPGGEFGGADQQVVVAAGGAGDMRSHSPKNPSSVAAAAAAAAAKSLSSGGQTAAGGAGGRSAPGWGGGGSGHGRQGQDPRYYDVNAYGGPQQAWPGEGTDGRGGGGYGQDATRQHSQSIHRGRPPPPYDQQGYTEGHGRSKRRHPNEYQGQFDTRADHDSHRYGYSDSARGGRGGDAPPPPFDQRSSRMRQDYFAAGPGGMAPVDGSMPIPPPMDNSPMQMSFASPAKSSGKRDAETPATVKRRGGTSRVIGTPTPIHVPRAADPPNSQYASTSQGSAEIFRNRPEDAAGSENATTRNLDDETPQRLLMSLRTPTTSFEENKPSSKGPPLSPEGPPQIQNAHQQRGDQPLIFEPQRSPRSQGTNLEMAPSFSLFNHSFDSLGEAANYLGVNMPPLDSGFQSHSFGAGPTGSGDNDNAGGGGGVPLLPSPINRDASFGQGALAQQILGGSTSGGMLTFGMSPENSFGNGPPSGQSRRRGNMMILADDGRTQSPTQVLGMYPTYSGGYGSQPGMQAPFRPRGEGGPPQPLGAGSFGPTMSQSSYTRSFDGMPPAMYPGPMAPLRAMEHPNGALSFYPFLRRNKAAFIKCTFLLPGLKAALLESPLTDTKTADGTSTGGGKKSSKSGNKKDPMAEMGRNYLEPTPHDTAIAMRRITSSVCAFGGSIGSDPAASSQGGNGSASSIFRTKHGAEGHATVTPSSSSGTPPGNRQSSRAKEKYDELLPTRYYENENRLSWEFEESPPVGSIDEDASDKQNRQTDPSNQYDGDDNAGSEAGSTSNAAGDQAGQMEGKKPGSPTQTKMRYRCKLCGLPKQNHVCPYQQSLQRSIGAMVYPAVNAFTSNEPGMLAPTLTDMNNFISSGSESVSSPDNSPGRPSPGRRSGSRATTPSRSASATNVTPETNRSSTQSKDSPSSTAATSTPTSTPQRSAVRTPRSSKRKGRSGTSSHPNTPGSQITSPSSATPLKRPHAQISDDPTNDLLFVDSVELKPEQFRLVTPTKKRDGAYIYPSLPLPYAQRKRLSDNLFSLSKEVPQLTDECAVVLREAREKDMWDLAVAELMTQVIIVIHCHEADTRLEGLRQYLLTLGIAC